MEAPLAIVRCAHFLSVMFLFGAGMFLAAFAPPDLRRRLSPRLRTAAIAASVIALFTAALWLALEAASCQAEVEADSTMPATTDATMRFTVSIGVAESLVDAACEPDPLLEIADRRLYAAKTSGRNRVVSAG